MGNGSCVFEWVPCFDPSGQSRLSGGFRSCFIRSADQSRAPGTSGIRACRGMGAGKLGQIWIGWPDGDEAFFGIGRTDACVPVATLRVPSGHPSPFRVNSPPAGVGEAIVKAAHSWLSVRLRGCIEMSRTQVDCDSADSSSVSSSDSDFSGSGGATNSDSKERNSSSPLRVALSTFLSCRSPESSISDTGSSM